LKIITSRRQSDIGFPGSAGSPEKRWPLAGYDARIAGFSYAEPRFKASGHWILRQDRGFSTRDEPLPSVSGTASRISSPANLPSAIEAAPSASGSVRQALLDLYKSSEKLSRSYST
jgi:hypothetical protein